MMLRPLRALPAHVISIALIWNVFSTKQLSIKRIIFWGVCAGLAAWYNFPNILFIGAAGVRILMECNTPVRRKTSLLIALGGGLCIGLLPLFGQNLFEGKAIYEIGEAARMLSGELRVVPKPYRHLPVVFGIHPSNIPYTFPPTLFHLWSSASLLWGILFSIGLSAYLVLQPKNFLLATSAVLPTLLFYGMYHGHIARYYTCAYLIMAWMSAQGWYAALSWCHEKNRVPRLNLRTIVGLLVTGGLLSGLLLSYIPVMRGTFHPDRESLFTRADHFAFRDWAHTHTEPAAIFLNMNDHLTAWTHWGSQRIRKYLFWLWTPEPQLSFKGRFFGLKECAPDLLTLESRGTQRFHDLLAKHKQIIFYEWRPLHDDTPVIRSWWKEDLLAHAQLIDDLPPLVFSSGFPYRLHAPRVIPFAEKQEIMLPPPPYANARLLLRTRIPDPITNPEPVTLRIFKESTNKALLTLPLVAGDQWLHLPELDPRARYRLQIIGRAPTLRSANWVLSDHRHTLRFIRKEVATSPYRARMLDGMRTEWRQDKNWGRDSAAHASDLKRTKCSFILTHHQNIRLPWSALPLRAHFLFSPKFASPAGHDIEKTLLVQFKGRDLKTDMRLIGPSHSKTDLQAFLCSFSMPPSDPSNTENIATFSLPYTPQSDHRIVTITFTEEPAPFSANPNRTLMGHVHPNTTQASPAIGSAMIMPDQHLLDHALTLRIPAHVAQTNMIARVHVTLPTSSLSRWPAVRAVWPNGVSYIFTPTNDIRSETLYIPLEQNHDVIQLSLANTDSGKDHVLMIVEGPELVPLTRSGALPAIIYPAGLNLTGLYPPEKQEGGWSAQWAGKRLSFALPVLKRMPAALLTLVLKMRGPQGTDVPYQSALSVNGKFVKKFTLPAWKDGWQDVPITFPIPKETTETLRFDIDADHCWRPSEVSQTRDTRELSFFLRDIHIRETPTP
jgi:hypothetical protein